MRVLIATILLIAIAQTAGAQQVIQTNLSFRQEVGYMIARFGSALYRDCGFPARPDTLNRRGKGFIAVDTCAMELGLWTGNVWKVIGTGVGGGGNKVDSVTLLGDSLLYWVNGSNFFVGDLGRVLSNGDTSILSYTLDSTGQPQGRVIYSGPGQKLNSQQFFIYSPTQRKLVLNNTNVSIGGNTYRLYVNGRSHTSGLHLDNMTNYIGAPQDDTKPPLAWDTNGDVVVYTAWPKVSSFAKNATRDSTILIFSNGQRFAVRDSVGGAGGITALTGDVTASGPGSAAATLATVNSNVGSFTNANITVNAKGLITAASSGSGGGMTNPMTTLGDIIRGGTGGAPQRLGVGSAGALLRIDPSTLIPEWTPFVLTDTIAIKRYGNVQAANVKSWDGGPTSALAQTIGSSGATITARDSVNYTLGFEAGNDMTSGWRNVFLGTYSGRKSTTAYANIGIGARTVGGNTSTSNTGYGNIGIGVQLSATGNSPLAQITSGFANTAVGSTHQVGTPAAGANITSGAYNSFFGSSAGGSQQSGNFNTAIGSISLSNNVSGSDNVAVGYIALSASTVSFNTAVGSRAGDNATTAQSLAFLGYSAGSMVTSGGSNTAFGSQSMASPNGGGSNLTGGENVALGNQSMAATASALGNVSHNRNVMVGTNAGRIHSTAINNNTLIGHGAGGGVGTTSSDAVTGSNNISIGAVSTLLSRSGSNQIVIGSSTDGTNPYRAYISDISGSVRRHLFNATTTDVSAIANASAAFEINGTGGGFLPPRMTATQAEAISSPAEGLLIYSTNGTGTTITSKGWWGYDGTTWVKLN